MKKQNLERKKRVQGLTLEKKAWAVEGQKEVSSVCFGKENKYSKTDAVDNCEIKCFLKFHALSWSSWSLVYK